MFEIRDPIHRTIPFSEREKGVIDHPYVQRLRHVRQLGLASIVYPGATHDRFTHALGAMHVAGRMWSRMLETSGDVLHAHFNAKDLAYFGQTLRFAGLLHDLGHPPFSHISEPFMPQFSALELPADWLLQPNAKRQARHEDYSVLLIAALAGLPHAAKNGAGEKIATPLSASQAQDIASLVHHGVRPSEEWEGRFGRDEGSYGIHRLLRSFISGELDCDRMDYLLRDAYYTGVAYGTHDIEQLIGNVGATEVPNKGLVRTIDASAVRAFEDFLLARYHMLLQVYHHKTNIAFDYILERAIGAGEIEFVMPGDAQGYSRLRDDTMYERLFAAAEDPKNAWSRRLTQRIPPKMLLVAANDRPDEKKLMIAIVAKLTAAGVPHFTITSKQQISKGATKKEGSAMLVRRKLLGQYHYEPVERYSALLTNYNEALDMTHLYVLREDEAAAAKAIA